MGAESTSPNLPHVLFQTNPLVPARLFQPLGGVPQLPPNIDHSLHCFGAWSFLDSNVHKMYGQVFSSVGFLFSGLQSVFQDDRHLLVRLPKSVNRFLLGGTRVLMGALVQMVKSPCTRYSDLEGLSGKSTANKGRTLFPSGMRSPGFSSNV